MIDVNKEIEALKSRISKLELNNSSNKGLFGKPLKELGSTSSETVISTLGTIKVKYGNRYVTIFKDGKLVYDNDISFIYKSDSIGTKDGIYIIGDKNPSIHVVIKGESYEVKAGETSYISFIEKLNITSEQREQALLNIGILYKSINDFNLLGIKNGVVYIQELKKLYIISNGILLEFTVDIPKELNINSLYTNRILLGEIVIDAEGINADSFNVGAIIVTGNDITVPKIICPEIRGSYYSIIEKNGESILTVDKLIVNQDSYKKPKYTSYDIVKSIEESGSKYVITGVLLEYKEGDSILISHIQESTVESEDNVSITTYTSKDLFFQYTSRGFECFDLIDNLSLEGDYIYLIKRDGKEIPLVSIEDNIEVIIPTVIDGEGVTYSRPSVSIGSQLIDDLYVSGITIGKNGEREYFCKYSDDSEEIPYNINDKTLVTAEWVKKFSLLPAGSIIAFHGENIPNGWQMCDGTNGTPDLIGKFIVADTEEKEGNQIEVTPLDSLSDVELKTLEINPGYYSLLFIMKLK